MTNAKAPVSDNRDIDQDQFLTILSREDALARFEAALFPRPVPAEQRPLSEALGCALSEDVVAPIDVPPFDRSNVDGFAVRSADVAAANETAAVRLMLNDEVIACGTAPTRPVLSGTATSIATGGPVPRGADAVIMVEHTQPSGSRAIEIRRAASPGQFVSYAGSDIARGEALLRAGTVDRLTRDRHAGGLRHRENFRGAPAARRCHLHRRRTGAARRAAAPRRDLRYQRRHRHRGDIGEWRRGGVPWRHSRRRGSAGSGDARGARNHRHAGAVRRHLKRRGRRLSPHHRSPRQARHHRPWRRAQAGQAAVPCGLRRQARDHPAGLSDLGDVHVSRHDRAGAAPDGGPAAALRTRR